MSLRIPAGAVHTVAALLAALAGLAFAMATKPMPASSAEASFSPEPAAAAVTNTLGLRLLQSLPDTARTPNLCLSPYSIAAALAMTYPGSDGETRQQMAQALGFPENPEQLAQAMSTLADDLLPVQEIPDVALWVANRLFGQIGTPFRAAFLQLLETRFRAPLEPTDFTANPEAARQRINAWVAKQTREKILDLLPAQAVSEDTRLVLVNALYFKAPWAEPFPAQTTQPGTFFTLAGAEKTVDFMHLTERQGYAEVEDYQVVALPYRGFPYQMLLILPAETETSAPAWPALFTAERLAGLAELPSARVQLALPKFRIAPPTINLTEPLVALGMPSAFDRPRGSANFDAIAPRRPDDYLFLSGVYHKTFLEVDEKGTEAAAATAVAMMRATMIDVSEPVVVTFNRPFWFALQHRPSGTCLFVGRVGEP